MKNYKLFVEQQNAFTVGLFPGAFKPPHKGHFATAKNMANENRAAIVLISSETRDAISAVQSEEIWELYKKYLPSNVFVFLVSGSPVTAIYQIVNILNNNTFVPTSEKSLAPLPEVVKIAENLQQNAGPYNVSLYASPEDMKRYSAFFNNKTSKYYQHKNVKKIMSKNVERLASATKARELLKNNNIKEFLSLLPDINDRDKQQITKILS